MHLIACGECDSLINIPESIDENCIVRCPVCKHKITSGQTTPLDTTIALSITSIILLVISIFSEFMSFKVAGRYRGIQIWDIGSELLHSDYLIVAGCFIICVIILPVLYMILILSLTVPLKTNFKIYQSPPRWIGIIIHHIKPWLMVEVFITGVLVALIKVISLVDLSFGLSFWAFVGFTICFTYLVYITDTHRLWNWIYEKSN